jgi:hypothetical protein
VDENRRLGKDQAEFELLDTGIFDDDRYFDVFVGYAKAGPDDILMQVTVHNRGPEAAASTRYLLQKFEKLCSDHLVVIGHQVELLELLHLTAQHSHGLRVGEGLRSGQGDKVLTQDLPADPRVCSGVSPQEQLVTRLLMRRRAGDVGEHEDIRVNENALNGRHRHTCPRAGEIGPEARVRHQ